MNEVHSHFFVTNNVAESLNNKINQFLPNK